jgi:predicted alpha-1,2-mannosidase
MPLLAWLAPRQTGDMMQSLVADATQGGWLPKWPIANDYTGEMNGDSADPIIAEAIAFGATRFDLRGALRLMVKGATRPGRGREGYEERPGLADYLRLGYVPPETGGYGSAATTLEYAIDDFAIARTAAALGDGATYRTFIGRARSWRRVFNSATGFVEPLFPDRTFPTSFDPTSTNGFVEGDSWQYSWMVPQDLSGLIRAMGGPDRVCRRLDRFFTQLNTGPDTPYDWAGNELGLEVPWEYDVAGCPWRAQAVVRRIMTQLYPPRPWGLPGNDDLGTMSAWYVWAALGLYPEIPGVPVLTIGSPLFRMTTIRPPGGLPIAIAAPAASDSTPYVHALELNGRPHAGPWISLRTLQRGAALRFRLGSTPGRAWGGTATAPPPAS